MTTTPEVISAQAVTPESADEEVTRKVIVAVHGIGDQFENATVQSVAYQFCRYYDVAPAIPLGRLKSIPLDPKEPFFLKSPPDPRFPTKIGFAEVYWAPIPRETVREGYILEKATVWAKTVVGRLRLRVQNAPEDPEEGKWTEPDPDGKALRDSWVDPKLNYEMVERVLLEVSEAITVLGRLLFVAEKAGVFRYDLAKLLDDYLNDVQVVAEFSQSRDSILKKFSDLMETVHGKWPRAEIYVVGHSEGSVIAFLSLLRAMAPVDGATTPAWVKQVRGLMTIGSPIDKHLVLWPELFEDLGPRQWPPQGSEKEHTIAWRNYFDYGDPIGFQLEFARKWLRENGWKDVFDIDRVKDGKPQNDIGFGRYALPGEAHVAYWRDLGVFGHFIEDVVKPAMPTPRSTAHPPKFERPTSKYWPRIASYVLPYGVCGLLLCLGVYFLYKAVGTYMAPKADLEAKLILVDTLRIAALIAGLTVVARIPRLTTHIRWYWIAAGLFLASLLVYIFGAPTIPPGCHPETCVPALVAWLDTTRVPYWLAPALAVAALGLGIWKPAWGVKSLLVPAAGVILVGVIAAIVVGKSSNADSGPIWPLFLAGAAFLYLWWLACLLFDLTFVWHRYVRGKTLHTRLETCMETAIEYDAKKEKKKRKKKYGNHEYQPAD
jgi:hypothetical protein